MSRLPRPYIPIPVRVLVAERQLVEWGTSVSHIGKLPGGFGRRRLAYILHKLFGDEKYHLDHDPALENRLRTADGGYIPDANHPRYLTYRTDVDHAIKTYVRGDGALRSDAGQRRYNKRVAKNRDPKRRKAKIPSRPFPKAHRPFRRKP